ncbi:MAG: hypothetical protein KAU46_06380 [Candidatus Aminicenantes bacterium]|nr:hypothetical protein [Candidatus Aminicenantes bacterium]
MSKAEWKEITEKVKKCREHSSSEKIISCLEKLYEAYKDGMVAFYLGREYEKTRSTNEAIKYYNIAENLFNLPSFRDAAKTSREKLEKKLKVTKNLYQINLSEFNPSTTLFIVSSSTQKIWNIIPNAPKHVTSRFAFRGKKFTDFTKWAEEEKIEERAFFWMILSGKYGLIKPWDNIPNYDGKNEDPGIISVPDKDLQSQLKEKRFWTASDGKIVDVRIIDFRRIICVNCSVQQLEKIKNYCPHSSIHPVYTEE